MSMLSELYAAIPKALASVFDGFTIYDHEPAAVELPAVWPGMFEELAYHHTIGGGVRLVQVLTIAVSRADERAAQQALWAALDPHGPLVRLERYKADPMPWRDCALIGVEKPYALVVGQATALAADVTLALIPMTPHPST